MAYFPGTQAFRQPYPLKRTKQGGDNRRATNAYGLPNLLARGFPVPGREAGNRKGNNVKSQPQGWSQGNAWWKQAGMTPQTKGQNPQMAARAATPEGAAREEQIRNIMLAQAGIGPGDNPKGPGGPASQQFIDPNSFLGKGGVGGTPGTEGTGEAYRARDPLEHLRYWAANGWLYKPEQQRFVQREDALRRYLANNPHGLQMELAGGGGGGRQPYENEGRPVIGSGGRDGKGGKGSPGGGGGGGGGQGGGGGGNGNGPPTNWEEVLAQLGLPLDPIFENQRNLLRSQQDMGLMQINNQYDTGTANANLQNVLANRGIDENMAARGLFGSGIERRDERLQNTSYTGGLLDLLQQKNLGTMQTQTGYNSGMAQAILELAQRSMKDPTIPIPDWYNWMKG